MRLINDISIPFTIMALVDDQGVLSCFEIVTYADVGCGVGCENGGMKNLHRPLKTLP